jgi:hypothetical protein
MDDPQTGHRWLLERQMSEPGGPGRLVLAGVSAGSNERPNAGSRAAVAGKGAAGKSAAEIPVIRAGDRLVVEESTPVAEARLEAIALSPASAGLPLRVRLKIGGKVVRAIALAPGRAKLAPETGGQP